MLRTLLICGLIAGACAGVLGFGFARVAGEGSVAAAIAFEEQNAAAGGEVDDGHAPVARDTQRGIGLLTATVTYGVALGGIFALVFAASYGRIAPGASPARTAICLAGVAFLVVFLIPFVKYPANPPATGSDATIQRRTLLYLTLVAVSVLSAVAAVRVRRWVRKHERWRQYGLLAGVASYVVTVGVVMAVLPGVSEIPRDFPATSLYTFRMSTVGLQVVIWATIGLVFAGLAQRKMVQAANAADARLPAQAKRA